MDFTRAITFILKEQDWWKKILITGLISIIPFVGFIYLAGWAFAIAEKAKREEFPLLPAPADIRFLGDGFRFLLAILVYFLPIFLVNGMLRLMRMVWVALFHGVLERLGTNLFSFLGNLANFLFLFLFIFIFPMLAVLFLQRRNWRDAMEFKKVYLMIREHRQLFLQMFFVSILCLIFAGMGVSVLYIGLIFTIPFAAAVFSHFVGQIGRYYW